MLRNRPLSVWTVAPTGCRARCAFSSASSRFSVSGVSRVASATCRGPVGSSTTTSSRHSSFSRKSMRRPAAEAGTFTVPRYSLSTMNSESPWKMSSSMIGLSSLGPGSRKLVVSGMTEFLSMIFRNFPLAMAKPIGIDSASSSVTASMLPSDSARSAAPSATDSSGCTPFRGGLPKCRVISCWTSGIRD